MVKISKDSILSAFVIPWGELPLYGWPQGAKQFFKIVFF